MAFEIERSTIGALAPLIERNKISPVELTEFYLERIKRLNPVRNPASMCGVVGSSPPTAG